MIKWGRGFRSHIIFIGDIMETMQIYERVNQITPLGENEFISHLNATINELYNKRDEKYFLTPEAATVNIASLSDGLNIYDEYVTPVIDNILFFATGDTKYKTDFTAHEEYAYRKVWRKIHKNRRIEREVW